MSVFDTPLTNAAWRDKPSWAVIATEDKAFDQAMLQHMAERAGAEITNVSASHAVFMTQAGVVSDVIVSAAMPARLKVSAGSRGAPASVGRRPSAGRRLARRPRAIQRMPSRVLRPRTKSGEAAA